MSASSEHWYDAGFDRSSWREAPLPGAWDLLDEAMRGYEGIGWYAVTLDGSWARAGRVQHLSFGRVMYHAKVWLNGEPLGEHIDGYLPFAFDVTGKLKRLRQPARATGRQSAPDRVAAGGQADRVGAVRRNPPARPRRESGVGLDLGPGDPGRAGRRRGVRRVHCRSRRPRGARGPRPAARPCWVTNLRRERCPSRLRAGTTSRHELTLKLARARTWSPRVAHAVHPRRDAWSGARP